jgi:hypothetical protein
MNQKVLKTKYPDYKSLIKKFLKDYKTLKPVDWAREVKICKTLVEKHGFDFLKLHFNNFKLNSLAWFLTKDGNALLLLEKVKQKTLTFTQERAIIEEEKIGEDIQVYRKPKSLKEFINYGKN